MVLATLAAQALTQPLPTSDVGIIDPPQTKQAGDLVVTAQDKASATKEATHKHPPIASPESLVVQEFAPEASSELPSAASIHPNLPSPISVTPKQAGEASSTISANPLQRNTTGYEDAQNVPTLERPVPPVTSIGIAPPETQVILAKTPAQNNASMPVEPSAVPQVASAKTLADSQNYTAKDLQQPLTSNPNAIALGSGKTACKQDTKSQNSTTQLVAQAQVPTTSTQPKPCSEVEGLRERLRDVENIKTTTDFQASPALSIVIPTGFGLDNNTGFISGTFQQRTRYGDVSDGALGVGIGLGDARKAVGVELSYAIASFGGSRDFGAGGFNVKLHRQLGDGWAVAAGVNGFANLGGHNDFGNSVYGVVSKVIRTRDDINLPFSRVAFTAGIGNGQFRTENDVATASSGVNVFGNVAVRVAKPVSLIAEWSGQDLGVGLSIAPFKNIPLVITPAMRDLAGAGDGPRFVLGAGLAFKF